MKVLVAVVLVAFWCVTADAQGTATSSISGTAVDSAGGVIPGASVVVTNKATGTKFSAVTSGAGTFTVPSLDTGVYTVSVSLMGFKTAVVDDVQLRPGTPTDIRAILEVGRLEESVTVTGAGAELVNTQTPAVTATLNVDQISAIPTPTRNVLNAATYLVGVNQTGIARGAATVNGLPESFLNITLDGVSNNDTFNKSTDAFFAPVRPRQDAIEAVSVTSAAGGADVGGSGAISINFVTRSGTNRFTGSTYEYFRHPKLNSNYWFNKRDLLEKNDVRLNQFGARQGGPIVRGKAFFFIHYEQMELPNSVSRNRTVLHPRALDGFFRYTAVVNGVNQIREVNVLELAGASGQVATTDPTVMRTLRAIQASPQITGVMNASSDPLLQTFTWQSVAHQREQQPAMRFDYNVNDRHRVSVTYNHFFEDRGADHLNAGERRFPGSPNYSVTTARRPADRLRFAPRSPTHSSTNSASASREASASSSASRRSPGRKPSPT